jgi:hypothetical protein
MNLDAASQTPFGDADGLRQFMLDHKFVHEQTAAAISSTQGISFGTYGVGSEAAEEEWVAMMQAGKRQRSPPALTDWLQLHSNIHQAEFSALNQPVLAQVDLSEVDFSSPTQFYDWMYAHQVIHDQVQQILGLT